MRLRDDPQGNPREWPLLHLLRPFRFRTVRMGPAMNTHKPVAVVLALDPDDRRQNIIADAIRANFSELMKLEPAARKQRIDEILKPNVERSNVTAR